MNHQAGQIEEATTQLLRWLRYNCVESVGDFEGLDEDNVTLLVLSPPLHGQHLAKGSRNRSKWMQKVDVTTTSDGQSFSDMSVCACTLLNNQRQEVVVEHHV